MNDIRTFSKFQFPMFNTHTIEYFLTGYLSCRCTANRERFARLNFSVFRDFQEFRESFSVNTGQSSYDGIV